MSEIEPEVNEAGTSRARLLIRRDELRLELDRLEARTPTHPQRYLYVLMAVSAIDASDRTLLATVFEDVKRALDATDTQLGLLIAAYSVVATASALPFGYLADRVNRVHLIALGFVPWALAQFWSAGAATFASLLVARLFLGTIEATNGPSTPSLIGDYYPSDRRGRAIGLHSVGIQVGSIIGFLLGGALATAFGWRQAFVVFGCMGLFCAVLVLKVLPEPHRGRQDALDGTAHELRTVEDLLDSNDLPDVAEPTAEKAGRGTGARATDFDYRELSLKESVRCIARVRTMWALYAGSAASAFFMASLATWVATFFRRYHGLTAAEAGGLLSLLTVGLIIGIIVGSRIGDRLMRGGPANTRVLFVAACFVLQFLSYIPMFTAGSLPIVIMATTSVAFFTGLPLAPTAAMGQLDVFVSHLRGRASALHAVVRVVATGAGPLAFGVLSDAYGLRSAWLYTMPALLVAAVVTLFALNSYPRDVAFAQQESMRQNRLEMSEALAL